MTVLAASPALAFGPPGWLVFGAVVVGTLVVGGIAIYETRQSSVVADRQFATDRVTSNTATEECNRPWHSGRVQAQGGNYGGIEKSLPWGQPVAPIVAEGLALLAALSAELSRSERAEREIAFLQATRWVGNRPPAGAYAVTKKSFPQPALRYGVRVDIEVLQGWAFKA